MRQLIRAGTAARHGAAQRVIGNLWPKGKPAGARLPRILGAFSLENPAKSAKSRLTKTLSLSPRRGPGRRRALKTRLRLRGDALGRAGEDRANRAMCPGWRPVRLAARLAAARLGDFLAQALQPDRANHDALADDIARRAVHAERLGDGEALGERFLHLRRFHVGL